MSVEANEGLLNIIDQSYVMFDGSMNRSGFLANPEFLHTLELHSQTSIRSQQTYRRYGILEVQINLYTGVRVSTRMKIYRMLCCFYLLLICWHTRMDEAQSIYLEYIK